MGPRSLKIVVIIALALSMLLSRSAIAAIGSSANYILDNSDVTYSATGGSSANYAIDGIANGYFEGNGDDYNICGGLTEETYGDCLPPSTPPPPSPGGGSGGLVAGGDDFPPDEEPSVETPEEPEPEVTPEEPVDPQIITFPEDDFVDRTIFPFVPPGTPLPPQPGAPSQPSIPGQPIVGPTAPGAEYPGTTITTGEDVEGLGAPATEDREAEEIPGVYPAPAEQAPYDKTMEKIQLEGQKVITKFVVEKELSPICICLLILLILLILILLSILTFVLLFTDKKTKERINKDINKNLKKLKKDLKKKLLP
jgi:hypothetical protein